MTTEREARAKGTFLTSYCNQYHHLSTGKPYKHECRVIPTSALKAEKRGDKITLVQILAETPSDDLSVARQGVSAKRLAATTMCDREKWTVGTFLASESWTTLKRITVIRNKDVFIVDCDATGTQLHSVNRVKTFPADIRRVK